MNANERKKIKKLYYAKQYSDFLEKMDNYVKNDFDVELIDLLITISQKNKKYHKNVVGLLKKSISYAFKLKTLNKQKLDSVISYFKMIAASVGEENEWVKYIFNQYIDKIIIHITNKKILELGNDIKPIFVTAPTIRNGITLIQRLLNSTKKVIIYGENQDFFYHLPIIAHSSIKSYIINDYQFKLTLNKFINQTTEFWSSSLNPDMKTYSSILISNFYKFALFYKNNSKNLGFIKWGIKNACLTSNQIFIINQFLKKSKFIYIYRNIFDVAKSAKARLFCKTENDFAQLATKWQQNLLPYLDNNFSNILKIKYENLVNDPDNIIQNIEQFTNISKIDRTVMQRKINTFARKHAQGFANNQYIKPIHLTEKEIKIIYTFAEKTLNKTGYKIKK